MEKAFFVTNTQALAEIPHGYARLYFGIEFCERLLPTQEELGRALDVAGQRKMAFTFVTPFLTDAGLEKAEALTAFLRDAGEDIEIVVNDFGFLHALNQKGWRGPIALGRLLTKQKRGPRLLNIVAQLPAEALEHFRQSNIDAPSTVEILSRLGVVRVELDNLLQGISRPEPVLKASLYTPYAYVTTTRYCLAAGCETPRPFRRAIRPCARECRKYEFTLSHKAMPVPLLLKGNTQFLVNDSLPDDPEALKIDRLVFQPHIPL